MLNISVCMITKNEEKKLPATLDAISKYDFEIIIADTGSTDSTIDIARKYTDKIYNFDWCDDFSAARNFSISKAGNDWILILDADEIITDIDIKQLIALTKLPANHFGHITISNHFDDNGNDQIYSDTLVRFFNKKVFHYEGIIHEQPRPIDKSLKLTSDMEHHTSIVCDHTGYAGSKEFLEDKRKRNLNLLLKELAQNPNDPYVYFQLGQAWNGFDDKKALKYYAKGLEFDVDPKQKYVQMMVIAYGYCLLHLEQYEDALSLLSIYDEFATSADFFTLIGVIYMRTGQYIKAMGEFLKATYCEVSHHAGANSYVPYYNMGCINELLGNPDSAIQYYNKCGAYPPAINRLKELTP